MVPRLLTLHRVLLLTIYCVLLFFGMQFTWASQSPCDNPHSTPLPSTNPAYADAMELARILRGRGFVVKCVLLSKEEHMFEGQEGAANYQTDVGVFEALFLPKPENFDGLVIIEQKQSRSYLYSFRGTPRSLPEHWEGVTPTYFVKHGGLLLHTLDEEAAVRLEDAFESP
jgi:hypothetical protein